MNLPGLLFMLFCMASVWHKQLVINQATQEEVWGGQLFLHFHVYIK